VPLEAATYISDLVSTNPAVADATNQGDDHIRLIKAALKATFPNITGPVTKTQAQLNNAGASLNISPANPAATSSLGGVHMGLGSSWTLTPSRTGTILITISGLVSNNTGGDGVGYHLRWGIGAAPANGAALTGASVTNGVVYLPNSSALPVPFSVQAVISGQTLGVAVWFDLALQTYLGGTVSAVALSCSAVEL
jgi:hypothetical protein